MVPTVPILFISQVGQPNWTRLLYYSLHGTQITLCVLCSWVTLFQVVFSEAIMDGDNEYDGKFVFHKAVGPGYKAHFISTPYTMSLYNSQGPTVGFTTTYCWLL